MDNNTRSKSTNKNTQQSTNQDFLVSVEANEVFIEELLDREEFGKICVVTEWSK